MSGYPIQINEIFTIQSLYGLFITDLYNDRDELKALTPHLLRDLPMDHVRTFRTGRIIFREGETLGNVYLVVYGKVKLVKDYGPNQTTIDYIEKGGIFGEMAMIDKHPRSATAIAEEDTECYIIDQDDFQKRLDSTDPFIMGIIRLMSERLRSTTGNYSDTKQKLRKIKTKMNAPDN